MRKLDNDFVDYFLQHCVDLDMSALVLLSPIVHSLKEVGFTRPYLVMLNAVLGCLALSLCWVYWVGLGDMHVTALGVIALCLGMSLNWMAAVQRPQADVDAELAEQPAADGSSDKKAD